MTFWLNVGVVYVLILGLGLAAGSYLASRFPRRGWGGGDIGPAPVEPPAPTFGAYAAADWPELGSAFDRQLLPGAFTDAPLVSTI
jgi:hypothetical protein